MTQWNSPSSRAERDQWRAWGWTVSNRRSSKVGGPVVWQGWTSSQWREWQTHWWQTHRGHTNSWDQAIWQDQVSSSSQDDGDEQKIPWWRTHQGQTNALVEATWHDQVSSSSQEQTHGGQTTLDQVTWQHQVLSSSQEQTHRGQTNALDQAIGQDQISSSSQDQTERGQTDTLTQASWQDRVSSFWQDDEFELSVRLLSGRQLLMTVTPEMQIKDAEARLEKELFCHRFCPVKLFHGTQELKGTDSVRSVGLGQGMELQATTTIATSSLCTAFSHGTASEYLSAQKFVIETRCFNQELIKGLFEILEQSRLCASEFVSGRSLALALALAGACMEDAAFCVPRLHRVIGSTYDLPWKISEMTIIGLAALGEAHAVSELVGFEQSIVDAIEVSEVAKKIRHVLHYSGVKYTEDGKGAELVRRAVRAVIRFMGKYGDMSVMHVLSDMQQVCQYWFTGQAVLCDLIADLDTASEQIEGRALVQDFIAQGSCGNLVGEAQEEINATTLPMTDDVTQEEIAAALPATDDFTQEELQRSDTEVLLQEKDDLQRALLASKADGPPPLSAENVVLFRFTRYSQEIGEALATSTVLEPIRARVTDAGCEIRPQFANGVALLVQLTAEQFAELGLALQPHHILARREDQPAIMEALRRVPANRRPKIRFDHRALVADEDCNAESDVIQAPAWDSERESNLDLAALTEERIFQMPVRHGFVQFDVPKDVSDISSSHACHSEPCGNGSEHVQPRNAHCFALSREL